MPTTITTTEELEITCLKLAESPYVTIDTEFIRERSYYPELCLVQLASDDCEVIVDPLAEGIDLAALLALLQNEKVTKVFHSGKQDIEIFYYLSGEIPQNVFDTQVAAMVCGFGAAASYASLVDQLVGQAIDKSSRFTDWSKRPLSQKQLDYAIGDVTHLRIVYHKLKEKLA
jgi:ribonuclease D